MHPDQSSFRLRHLVLAALTTWTLSAPVGSQPCGNIDVDPSDAIDINDLSALLGHLYVGGALFNYGNAELDGRDNVNIADLQLMVRYLYCDFIYNFSCTPLGTPIVPQPKAGTNVWLDKNMYPADIGTPQPLAVRMYFSVPDPITSLTVPFQVQIGGMPAIISIVQVAPLPTLFDWELTDGTTAMVGATGCAEFSATNTLLAQFEITAATSSSLARSVSMTLVPYPTPVNPVSLAPVHLPMFLKKDGTQRAVPDSLAYHAILPTVCTACSNATPLGNATLTDSSGLLIVDNIGPSGNDGVSFEALDADSIQLDFVTQNLIDSGSEMSVGIVGTVSPVNRLRSSSPTDVVLMGWKIANAGGPLQLTCDFNPLGDPNVLIAAYNGATLQGSTTVPGGGVVSVATSAGFGNPVVKSFWMVKSNPATFEVEFDRVATVTTTNSQVYQATRVRFIALGQTIPIQQIKTVQVAGKSTRLVIAKFFARTGGCCRGFTGNVDCDVSDNIDIADVTRIIDYLYISFSPLCCQKSANCDGSPDGNIDISDLTALLDFSYISFTPTAPCQ